MGIETTCMKIGKGPSDLIGVTTNIDQVESEGTVTKFGH